MAKHIEGTKRLQPQPPHTRGTFHRRLQPLYTEKHKVSCFGFLPTTHSMQHSCTHSNAICNHSFKKRIELHTGTTIVAKHIEGTKRPQPQLPHRRGTCHRRLYAEKHKVLCSGFLSKTKPMQHSCSHSNAICNHSFKKRIELHRNNHCCKTHRRNQTTAAATAAHTRYLSSPAAATLHGKTQGFVLRLPPQLTTCLRHRFPSSPLPFLTTPLHHHFPSSPLPFLTTSHRHRFPSSPLPFLTTPLHHHFPSSPLPFLTASHRHRFPSSPLPFLTTPLHHHFPSSPLPIVTTSLHHHPIIVSTLHQGQFHRFLFFCYVLICYHFKSQNSICP